MAEIKEVSEVPKEVLDSLTNKVRRGRPRNEELLSLLNRVTNLNGTNILCFFSWINQFVKFM